RPGRGTEGEDLGVRGRIALGERSVVGAGDHAAVVDDHGPDRDLARRGGLPGLLERQPERGLVVGLVVHAPTVARAAGRRQAAGAAVDRVARGDPTPRATGGSGAP